ncbi:5-formyltetrahydrofolate cyclo-ligase [Spirosoma sp. HMF3257]|uniref:5-formyltetrahydrofolate cyclo-ligase n=1 Tax=Spirosoma telluris TaxID=2183553 RepID=A0A327NRK3_9BACT|nr:5-formyltetrahydrofolate cyclo-ligase [Spirosoma telluris]RAI76586.1 5-formyltetrahydrofolate cyclo-ligase [Spirosoma telluris]
MTKVELRREFLTRRKALAPDDVNHRSQLIADRFFAYFEHNNLGDTPTTIHTFLPIKRHNEVDTWLIIKQVWLTFSHLFISVPVTDEYTYQLINYTIFPSTPLVANRLGIPEPAIGSRYETNLDQISVVLVPLLAFDLKGNRVGYGGGYYDRFLAEQVPDSLKIGLSLFDPVKQIDGIEFTDIKLDACITPEGLYTFD